MAIKFVDEGEEWDSGFHVLCKGRVSSAIGNHWPGGSTRWGLYEMEPHEIIFLDVSRRSCCFARCQRARKRINSSLEADRPGFKWWLLHCDSGQVSSPLCASSVNRSYQNQSSWVAVRLTPNTAIPLYYTHFWRKTEFLIWIVRLGTKPYPVCNRTRLFPNDSTIH